MDTDSLLHHHRELWIAGREGAALVHRGQLRAHGVDAESIQATEAVGRRLRVLIDKASAAVQRDPVLEGEIAAMLSRYPSHRADLGTALQHLAALPETPPVAPKAAGAKAGSTSSQRSPRSKVGTVGRAIGDLPAGHGWTLSIDETGSNFKPGAPDRGRGRVVAIVHRTEDSLPSVDLGFHAIDASVRQRTQVIRRLLGSRAAAVGLDIAQVDAAPDAWAPGIATLLSWILICLPVPLSGKVTVKVSVEQRGSFAAGSSWKGTEALIQARLHRVCPDLASRLRLTIQIVAKGDRGLVFADAVAFAWQTTDERLSRHLSQNGLADHLYDAPAGPADLHLDHLWRLLDRQIPLDGEGWRWALAQRAPAGGFVARAHDLLNLRLTVDDHAYAAARAAALAHLEDKALDLRRASYEIAALVRARPGIGDDLPAAAKLAWITGRLSLLNHQGGSGNDEVDAEQAMVQEIERLGDLLFDERPELVCLADLHRAVHFFNLCAIDDAERAVARWRGLPLAIGGLQMRARALSTQGQHLAFRGELRAAVREFDQAIHAFGRLSDPKTRQQEIAQTSTYRLHALLDDPTVSDRHVREELTAYLGDPLVAIAELARTEHSPAIWRHHVLLRWLTLRATDEERRAYLARERTWATGESWPWPILHGYRAALLQATDPDRALDFLELGAAPALTEQVGPALWLVGSALRCAATTLDATWDERDEQLDEVAACMPGARPWLDRLRAVQVGDPIATTLRDGLPWGFR